MNIKKLFNDIFYMIRSGRQEYDNSRSQIETPCGETTWGPHSCLTKETYSIIPNTNDYNFWRHCNPFSNLRMACGFLNMVSIMSQAISSIGELITRGGYLVGFRIGMLSTARRLETLRGSKKGVETIHFAQFWWKIGVEIRHFPHFC